jgi:hypothetical protein
LISIDDREVKMEKNETGENEEYNDENQSM